MGPRAASDRLSLRCWRPGEGELPVETRSPWPPGRQGTVIVERWWKVPLAGEGRNPHLHRRHRVYKLVEDTKHRPKDNLELILTQSVEGKLGQRLALFAINFFLPLASVVCRSFSTLWKWSQLYI